MVARMDSQFLPLQDNPIYYSDEKRRFPVPRHRLSSLISYKPNFGKKIWIATHRQRDVEKASALAGDLLNRKTMRMTPIEIGKEVGPWLKPVIRQMQTGDEWKKSFEEWGRSYADLGNAGKKLCTFVLMDYSNGNFLLMKPRRGDEMVCFYLPEKFDPLVKRLMDYRTREERKMDMASQPEEFDRNENGGKTESSLNSSVNSSSN
jgi:hypothetical protein